MPGTETRALVVVGHPRAGNFSAALAQSAAETLSARGFLVTYHDLYQERFDPVLHPDEIAFARESGEEAIHAGGSDLVAQHRRELIAADILVLAHPNWWGKPPAIVAGWIDRVLSPGVAYRLDERVGAPRKLLGLSEVIVANTSDTLPEVESDLGDPLESMWVRCVGRYLNARIERMVAAPIGASNDAQRSRWLNEFSEMASAAADRITAARTA